MDRTGQAYLELAVVRPEKGVQAAVLHVLRDDHHRGRLARKQKNNLSTYQHMNLSIYEPINLLTYEHMNL